ncbi:hypothetical protein C7458_10825 [Williamsia muralis]|nr:hypothetical protein C7458_10825 [Williamsia marianensis]
MQQCDISIKRFQAYVTSPLIPCGRANLDAHSAHALSEYLGSAV